MTSLNISELQFNLTCKENQLKLTMIGTINNIGLFLFMPLTGYISDRLVISLNVPIVL